MSARGENPYLLLQQLRGECAISSKQKITRITSTLIKARSDQIVVLIEMLKEDLKLFVEEECDASAKETSTNSILSRTSARGENPYWTTKPP